MDIFNLIRSSSIPAVDFKDEVVWIGNRNLWTSMRSAIQSSAILSIVFPWSRLVWFEGRIGKHSICTRMAIQNRLNQETSCFKNCNFWPFMCHLFQQCRRLTVPTFLSIVLVQWSRTLLQDDLEWLLCRAVLLSPRWQPFSWTVIKVHLAILSSQRFVSLHLCGLLKQRNRRVFKVSQRHSKQVLNDVLIQIKSRTTYQVLGISWS